jgi:hypothetical protein
MALVVKDRVQETSTTTGTGTFTLAGAVSGFQSFSIVGTGNTTYYAIVGGTQWEVGLGTYTSSGTILSRDTVLSSSTGSIIDFAAGTKSVFVTYPASKSVTTDAIGTIASQNSDNVSITGGSVAVTANPTSSLEVATKQYVDAAVTGLHVHDAVSCATTAALTGTVTYNNGSSGVGATLTLGTALTILDGYTLLNNNRVLVKNQANAAHNGIYNWATGGTVLTRATDADTTTELNGGDFFFVTNGTVNGDTGWLITDQVTTIGTSDVNFTQFSGAGTYSAGTGLTLTGTQFSLTTPVTVANGGTNATTASIASFNNITGYTASGATGTTSTNLVFSTSPTLVTPALGTPTALVGTNITGTATSFNINGTVGATTPNTGAFTSLSASSTVSGTGFSTYLASPPAIGTTAAAAGNFTSSQITSLGVGTAASGTTGEIRATNNVTSFYSSDMRLKENITDIPYALDKVNHIGGKLFDWTDDYINSNGGEDGYFVNKSDFGVIAQDVKEVFPIAVRERKDGTLAVDYEKLCALAFAAIKELTEKVNKLENK